MIDHPNMSYCQFENTSHAIDQLINNMADALNNNTAREFVEDMNQYEREAFESMHAKLEELQEMLAVMEDCGD